MSVTSPQPTDPRVLTALPVYNEAAHLAAVLEEVRRYCADILVVDDGSTDGTAKLLDEIPEIQVVHHPVNRGYGAGLKTAFEFSVTHDYDALVTIDCDGQHEPRLIPQIAAELDLSSDRPWDIVSGSRYLKQFDDNSIPPEDRRAINMQITRQLNACFGLQLTDSFCGFKAYRVAALPKFEVTELGYAMPLQFWVQAVAHEMRIKEFAVPLVYLDEKRSFGGSLDDSQQRMAYYQQVLKREMERQDAPCGAASSSS